MVIHPTSYMSFVFFNSDLYRSVALSNVYLPAFTRDAVYSGCSQSHGILDKSEVVGYFLRWQWDTFSIMFGQHSAESSIGYLRVCYVCRSGRFVLYLGGFC
jgi:hypothetical protein